MEKLSDCCSAAEWNESHLCSSCKEYAEFEEEEEEVSDFRNEQIKKFMEDWRAKQ
jgi:hypothetical protein